MAPFVGICEIVCGVLFILGLLIRFAAVTMIINMLVAIWTTKIPILLNAGFWSMAHEARTDYAMLLGSVFLHQPRPRPAPLTLCPTPGRRGASASSLPHRGNTRR